MPRAPMWSASIICCVGIVEVRSRIFTEGEPFMMARMASRPGSRGMATSRRRISGCSSRVWVIASSPSSASPTTSKPSSAVSILRTPIRTTGWSSANMIRVSASTRAGPSRGPSRQNRAKTNLHEPAAYRFRSFKHLGYLSRKFYLKHTLQIFLGQRQFNPDRCGVIQFVTLRLQQGTEARSLAGSKHAISTFDGLSNATYFSNILLGDSNVQCGHSFLQVRHHRNVDLAHGRFRHHLAELAQNLCTNHRFVGTQLGRRGFEIVLVQKFLQRLRTKGLLQKSVDYRFQFFGEVASADGVNGRFAAGS